MGQQVCAPWAAPEDLCCEGDQTIDDCVDGQVALDFKWTDDDFILAASNLLYARTGFRWPGACQFTVWPCVDGCSSAHHPCVSCCSYEAIELPTDYPVVSVDLIDEGGVILPDTDYRLERGNIVVRTDGLRWQRNTFGLPGASGIETTVTFTAGTAPPIEGQMAAAALACEMKKACNEGTCALPSNVRSFVRRGVAVELNDILKLMSNGLTGIDAVDRFLATWEPFGQGSTMFDPASKPRGYRTS